MDAAWYPLIAFVLLPSAAYFIAASVTLVMALKRIRNDERNRRG